MVRIEIKPDDIRLGVRGNDHKCPVARALRRVFKSNKVEVIGWCVFIEGCLIILPKRIELLIRDYDSGKDIKTTRFELQEPKDKKIIYADDY